MNYTAFVGIDIGKYEFVAAEYKVKSFIRSFGQKAKTDSIDAQALASYG